MGLDKTLETLARRAMCNEKADGSNFETLGPIAIAMDTVTADEISPAGVEAGTRKASATTDKMPMIVQCRRSNGPADVFALSHVAVENPHPGAGISTGFPFGERRTIAPVAE
ncbi:MAG: hypothetical protein Q9199_001289 [Rusavskia elegans]